MNRYYLLILSTLVSPTTFAVTLTGGTIDAYAMAGMSGWDCTMNIDDPAPAPIGMGSSSLSASANGTVSHGYCSDYSYATDSSTTGSANISNLVAGEISFQLSSNTSGTLAHMGPGYYDGANANSSVTVQFELTYETHAMLEWNADTYYGSASVIITKDGTPLDISSSGWGMATQYLFGPGLYELYVATSLTPAETTTPYSNASMSLTVATPLPASLWLLGSALLTMGTMVRGRSSVKSF